MAGGSAKGLSVLLFGAAAVIGIVNYVPGFSALSSPMPTASGATSASHLALAGFVQPQGFGGLAPYLVFGLTLCAILAWAWSTISSAKRGG